MRSLGSQAVLPGGGGLRGGASASGSIEGGQEKRGVRGRAPAGEGAELEGGGGRDTQMPQGTWWWIVLPPFLTNGSEIRVQE